MKTTNNYKTEVLQVNANFKQALRTTGQCIKILLASEVLNTKQIAFLKSLQKDDNKYSSFDAKIRRTKDNKIVPFYVLQAVYKELNK